MWARMVSGGGGSRGGLESGSEGSLLVFPVAGRFCNSYSRGVNALQQWEILDAAIICMTRGKSDGRRSRLSVETKLVSKPSSASVRAMYIYTCKILISN